MKRFNFYSNFIPTLSYPICKHCAFAYCRDFSCFHHNFRKETKKSKLEAAFTIINIENWVEAVNVWLLSIRCYY